MFQLFHWSFAISPYEIKTVLRPRIVQDWESHPTISATFFGFRKKDNDIATDCCTVCRTCTEDISYINYNTKPQWHDMVYTCSKAMHHAYEPPPCRHAPRIGLLLRHHQEICKASARSTAMGVKSHISDRRTENLHKPPRHAKNDTASYNTPQHHMKHVHTWATTACQ